MSIRRQTLHLQRRFIDTLMALEAGPHRRVRSLCRCCGVQARRHFWGLQREHLRQGGVGHSVLAKVGPGQAAASCGNREGGLHLSLGPFDTGILCSQCHFGAHRRVFRANLEETMAKISGKLRQTVFPDENRFSNQGPSMIICGKLHRTRVPNLLCQRARRGHP